jgi:hypothetical protein
MTFPANTTAFYAPSAAPVRVAAPLVRVALDGRTQPRLRAEWVEHRLGEAPRARLSAALGRDALAGDDLRLEQAAARLRPGQAVTVTLLGGGTPGDADAGDLVLFEGRIGRVDLDLAADAESLAVEAEDPAADVLRRRVAGRRGVTAAGTVARVDGLPLVFNPDGRAGAAADLFDPGTGDGHRVFAPDGAADAVPWTLDEAVAYLLAEHGASADVDVPAPSEVRAALPPLVLRDVSLEGRTLADALAALLDMAGARLVVSAEPGAAGVSRRLDLWHPGRAPAGWLAHQSPGAAFAAGATTHATLSARLHFEAAPRRYVARGDRKVYESTFDLVAGWDAALETYDPDDFSPSAAGDAFAPRRDVFRKWVLNETGEYAAAPYNRGPAPDLAAVFEGAATVARRRRLLPCVSRDSLGRSRGVAVEVSLDAGESWEQPALAARVLSDEAGVALTDDPLPPRYLAAAMRGLVRVRVTAALESDACLAADAGDDAAGPGCTRHVHVPAGYRFRRVTAGSRFFGDTGGGETDDAARLADLVRAAHDADLRSPAPARINVPWLALGHRVGQRLLGVRGRRLDLARRHDGYAVAPVVARVRLCLLPRPSTELELE